MQFSRWGYSLRGGKRDKHLIIHSSTYPMETHKHMLATHYSTPQASHAYVHSHSFLLLLCAVYMSLVKVKLPSTSMRSFVMNHVHHLTLEREVRK